jgi:H/ACA ribonucleoprotein complex subunit 2
MSDVEQPTTTTDGKKGKDSSNMSNNITDGKTYEERVKAINIICQPLASKRSTKKAHKLVKKAAQAKYIRRGVKESTQG